MGARVGQVNIWKCEKNSRDFSKSDFTITIQACSDIGGIGGQACLDIGGIGGQGCSDIGV